MFFKKNLTFPCIADVRPGDGGQRGAKAHARPGVVVLERSRLEDIEMLAVEAPYWFHLNVSPFYKAG